MTGHDADMTELDRRGRAAAAGLRARVEALAADDRWLPTGESTPPPDPGTDRVSPRPLDGTRPAPDAAPGVPVPPEPLVVPPGRGPDRRRPSRAAWSRRAAAAVALLAVTGGAAVVLTRDGGRPDVTSGGAPDLLLPGWLPAGFEPTAAADLATLSTAGIGGDVVVYGDPEADDPWASTIGVMHLVGDGVAADDLAAGAAVTVAGHEATISETRGPTGASGPGSGWQVEWRAGDGRMVVGGSGGGLTRDDVLAAAEAATTEPGIAPDGLPAGYAELARGPLGASSPTTFADGRSGLAVTYKIPTADDAGETALYLVQQPAPASAVDLLRGSYPDAEATTVRGHHAVLARGLGQVVVQWAEPDGQLVSLTGMGLGEEQVLRAAEAMRPADPGEVAGLLAEHAVPAAGEFQDVPEGHVVVAEGETPTARWRVVADTTVPAGLDALTIERVSESTSSSGSSSSGLVGGGPSAPPPLELITDTEDGWTIVYGLADADTREVTVDGAEPGGTGGAYRVDGWDRRVIVVDMGEMAPAGPGGEAVGSVVTRAADGRELGRYPILVGPAPPTPDVEEECTTSADGTTGCSTTGTAGATDTIPG